MPTSKVNTANFQAISSALQRAGLKGNELVLALAQIAHESAGFTDKKIKSHLNPSGIVYAGSAKQKGATRGNPLPENRKYNYAKFDTINDWAKDYIRIVGKTLKSASSATDFAKKLGNKGYYEVSSRYPNAVQNYANALNYWANKITVSDQPTTSKILLPALALVALLFIVR